MKDLFNRSLDMVRFMLRRERVVSVLWIVLLVLFSVALVPGLGEILGDTEEQAALLAIISEPSMIAMMGPLYDATTTGGMFGYMMLLWTMLAVGVMNMFLIVRHTRADEEWGRTEVIRSLPVGRLTTLNAAMITAVIVNAVLALLTGLGMAAMGEPTMGFGGCMLYGVMLGVYGLFIAALTAVFCQLCASSRTALGYSGLLMLFFYILRAAGDMPDAAGNMPNEILSYLSPMGLLQRAKVFAGNVWWPVLAVLGIIAALTALAFALDHIRDLGQGFIPARPGRKEAKKSLLSPFGLSWRLMRMPLIAWTLGLFSLGYSYGMIMGNVDSFIEGNDFYGNLMIDVSEFPMVSQAESYAATINIMIAICCVIPVLLAVYKLRNEEKDGRLEHVLSRAVSRMQYFGSYVALAFAVSVAAPFMSAVGFYMSGVSVMDNPLPFGFFLKNSLVFLPALWVTLGLAVLLVGLIPRATAVGWGLMAYSMFALFFGRVMQMPEWMIQLTPFGHIPLLIIEDVSWLTMGLLTAIAAVLTTAGFHFYRKRDMLTA